MVQHQKQLGAEKAEKWIKIYRFYIKRKVKSGIIGGFYFFLSGIFKKQPDAFSCLGPIKLTLKLIMDV